MIVYPIKFTPILQDKLWGGEKLITELNKNSTSDKVGESWEISDVEGHISVVANGEYSGMTLRELLKRFKHQILGSKIYDKFGEKFPLLIKYIDAKQDLSIQVHPNNELSKQRHNSFGKTEMWYVMQADSGSELILGFSKDLTAEDYLEHLKLKTIEDVMHYEPVCKGDSFFIETGTVHAIGAGIVIAEIQQTSDITYRIYDFERLDDTGNSRELHTDLALDALNFKSDINSRRVYNENKNDLNNIVDCEYFRTNFLPVENRLNLDYSNLDSFVIFMCVAGNGTISINNYKESLKFGETLLIPAKAESVLLTTNGQFDLLEITVP